MRSRPIHSTLMQTTSTRAAFPLALALLLTTLCLTAPAASADTIELKDGRVVEGMLIPDPDPDADPKSKARGFYVLSRFGPTFVRSEDVKKHVKAKPMDLQIKEYIAALEPKDVTNRVRLADWMKDVGREEEARELARQILEWQPENAKAHDLLGHVRHKGRWRTPDEARRADGFEKHGGKWFTPTEWKNVASAEKEAAAAVEAAAAEKFIRAEANKAVRLILSPDPAVRSRGKARLQALAKEFDSERLRKLLAGIDEYIKNIDELRRQASNAAANVSTDGGMVMGEIRATLSKLKRPIKVLQTNLASGPIGANAPVSIMLPEMEIIKVRSAMAVPAVVR